MTPSESEEARTRTLLAACGFGALALVAVAVLLALGLKGSATSGTVVASPRAATASAGRQEAAHRSTRRCRRRSREDSSSRPPASGTSGSRPPPRLTRTPPNWSRPSSGRFSASARPQSGRGSAPAPAAPRSIWFLRLSGGCGSTSLDGSLHGRRTLQRAFASVPTPARRQAGPRDRPPPDGLAALDRQRSGSSSVPATPRTDGTRDGVARSVACRRARATTPARRGRAPRATGGRRRAACP